MMKSNVREIEKGLPETTMSGTLLDLDCPRSWPVELLGYLNEHHDLFRGWVNGQGQVSAKAHDEAWSGLRRALQPYQIFGLALHAPYRCRGRGDSAQGHAATRRRDACEPH